MNPTNLATSVVEGAMKRRFERAALPASIEATFVVCPKGGRIALSEISTLIRAEGGELWATAPAISNQPRPAYTLRLVAPDPHRVLVALHESGHSVIRQERRNEQAG